MPNRTYRVSGHDFGEPESPHADTVKAYSVGDTFTADLDPTVEAALLAAGLLTVVYATATVTAIPKTSDFTVASADAGGRYHASSASAITATVPANSDDAVTVGAVFEIVRRGTGVVAINPDTGVTLNSVYGYRNLARQYSAATLVKVDTDEWDLHGDLA